MRLRKIWRKSLSINPSFKDLNQEILTQEDAQELVEALWLKLSEWVWTISANTAGFFAGYNQFQNLTVGGKTREGFDATNLLSYMCLKATDSVRTHQPGLSVRIHTDCPQEFLAAVRIPVMKGLNFTKENLTETATFMKRYLPDADIELLPYHNLGHEKYKALGLEDYIHDFAAPSKEELIKADEMLRRLGVKTISYK